MLFLGNHQHQMNIILIRSIIVGAVYLRTFDSSHTHIHIREHCVSITSKSNPIEATKKENKPSTPGKKTLKIVLVAKPTPHMPHGK